MKEWNICKLIKPLSEFPKDRSKRDGLAYNCKQCRKIYKQKWDRENKQWFIDYKIKNKDVLTKKRKEYHLEKELKKLYNISRESFESLLLSQKGCCAICHKHYSELTKSLAVEHDHDTNKVRGLLCFNCNIGLGKFQDKESLLFNAINYLKDNRRENEKE